MRQTEIRDEIQTMNVKFFLTFSYYQPNLNIFLLIKKTRDFFLIFRPIFFKLFVVNADSYTQWVCKQFACGIHTDLVSFLVPHLNIHVEMTSTWQALVTFFHYSKIYVKGYFNQYCEGFLLHFSKRLDSEILSYCLNESFCECLLSNYNWKLAS